MPGRNRRGTAGGHQQQPVRKRQDRRAAQLRRRPGHRDRPAHGLRQPGLRPGRAGLRWRLFRAQCRPHARPPEPGLGRGHRNDHLEPREGFGGRRLDLRCWHGHPGGQRSRPDLPGDDPRPARLCEQERLPGRGARPLGRHRLGIERCGRRGRARRRAGLDRDDAKPLHQPGEPGRRRRLRGPARLPPRHRLHRARHGRLRCHARRSVRRQRRGYDGRKHPVPRPGHDPDGAVQQVRPHGALGPATSRKCRSATRPSTATCAAAIRC